MKEWANEYISYNEWATSSLRHLFAEAPLLSTSPSNSAASYLGYFFSDPLLLWVASLSLQLFCLLQASSSLCAARIMCFAAAAILRSAEVALRSQLTTYPPPFRNVQLQSRMAGESDHRKCLCGAVPMLNRIPWVFLKVFREIELALQLRAHFSSLIFQKCSEREVKSAFRTKSNFRCSLMRFSDLSFQQWSENAFFYVFGGPQIKLPLLVQSPPLSCCVCVDVWMCVCVRSVRV